MSVDLGHRVSSLLWAVQKENASYWAFDFIAGALIPYGIDLYVFSFPLCVVMGLMGLASTASGIS